MTELHFCLIAFEHLRAKRNLIVYFITVNNKVGLVVFSIDQYEQLAATRFSDFFMAFEFNPVVYI